MLSSSPMDKIGFRAFDGCTALEDLKLNTRLRILGEKAFTDCDALTMVTIPGSVQTVGESA